MPRTSGTRKRTPKPEKSRYGIDNLLRSNADQAQGDMPVEKTGQLGQGMGMENEERYLVVPDRLMALITALLVEAGGTYLLILFVDMAIATLALAPASSRIGSALAYGGVFAFIHAIFSKYSGGHFNPATSLAIFLGYQFSRDMEGEWFKKGVNKLTWGTMYLVLYTLAQILFSFFAGWTLQWVLHGDTTALGAPFVGAVTSPGQAFFVELVATMIITMGYFILMMERTKGHQDSILFGVGIAGLYLATAAITGGAFNPVRFMGAAIADLPGFSWRTSYVYICGPYAGAIIAWGLYEIIRVILVPSKQYVGWIPLIFGPKSKMVYAHYVRNDDQKKLFIRM